MAIATYKRDDILADLRENIVEVTFNKVSTGESRIMKCTLRPELLPKTYAAEQEQEMTFHVQNPDTIAAWDIEKNGWRSFKIPTVTYVQIVDHL